MPQLIVKKGSTKALPKGQVFATGLGWDTAPGADSIDLDLWIIRFGKGGPEPISWANQDLLRPDLGQNSDGNPWIATPELDVIHKGDDRTGAESDTGYDETATRDLGKSPPDVTSYAVFATYYDEHDSGNTLGMATNVTFGCRQEGTPNELIVKLDDKHGFDITVLLCTIERTPTGWTMTSKQDGYTDDMITLPSVRWSRRRRHDHRRQEAGHPLLASVRPVPGKQQSKQGHFPGTPVTTCLLNLRTTRDILVRP